MHRLRRQRPQWRRRPGRGRTAATHWLEDRHPIAVRRGGLQRTNSKKTENAPRRRNQIGRYDRTRNTPHHSGWFTRHRRKIIFAGTAPDHRPRYQSPAARRKCLRLRRRSSNRPRRRFGRERSGRCGRCRFHCHNRFCQTRPDCRFRA